MLSLALRPLQLQSPRCLQTLAAFAALAMLTMAQAARQGLQPRRSTLPSLILKLRQAQACAWP